MVKHETDYNYVRPTKFGQYSVWMAPVVVLFGSFSLYIKTMAPSVFWGDSAAFAATNFILGLPHSPSFPLYTLIGRVFNLIPGITPAFASNLMSAVLASLAVMFFYLLIREFIDVPVIYSKALQRRMAQRISRVPAAAPDKAINLAEFESITQPMYILLPSLLITALFAVILPVWLSAVRAEVYSLHLCLIMAALLFGFRGNRYGYRKSFLIGLWLYALSFANHPLLSLAFAPAFLYLTIYHIATCGQKLKTLGLAALFFMMAFSVYLYLPLRAAFDPAINWGRPDSLETFLAAITRSADMVNFSEMTAAPDYLMRLKKIGFFMAGQIGWPLIGLVVLGFWGQFKISWKLFPFLILALLGNLAIVLWAAEFNRRNYDMVNYLAPLAALILVIGLPGVMYLLRTIFNPSKAALFISVVVIAFAYVALDRNMAEADMSAIDGPDTICREIISGLPAGSIFLTAEDDLLLPLWYHAYVDSSAQHIRVLSPGAMVNPINRRQFMANYPGLQYSEAFQSDRPGKPDSLAIELCRLNAPERDIYLQFGVPGIKYHEIAPAGIVFKYVGGKHDTKLSSQIYDRHLALAAEILAGNALEARTCEFVGRWLFTIGVYCDRTGSGDYAWALFNTALDIDKENIDMRIRLASALAMAGRYSEALKYVSAALEIDSQDPASLELGRKIVEALNKQKAVATK
nr:DUF2723 domain-containing protein [candidate division Zixibacteria bacterium]